MKRHLVFFVISLTISLLIQLLPVPANAQRPNPAFNRAEWDWYDCPASTTPGQTQTNNDILGLPLALKLKFPLDLIYPISPKDLDVDSKCIKTSLWGIQRDMCAPMQIAKVAKDTFLLKVVLQSLFSL